MGERSKVIKLLQIVHLVVFATAWFVIFLLHRYTGNFLDFLRIPLFLQDINYFLGFSWPASLYVYQLILLFSLFLILIDALGLFFYKSRIWRMVSDISSFLGFLVIWPVALFFIFTLASAEKLSSQNIQTIVVYFAIAFVLLILDLVTWFVDEEALLKFKTKTKPQT